MVLHMSAYSCQFTCNSKLILWASSTTKCRGPTPTQPKFGKAVTTNVYSSLRQSAPKKSTLETLKKGRRHCAIFAMRSQIEADLFLPSRCIRPYLQKGDPCRVLPPSLSYHSHLQKVAVRVVAYGFRTHGRYASGFRI